MKKLLLILNLFVSYYISAQNPASVPSASGNWSSLIKLAQFDPNDDQQSVADTDFVGNETYPIMETQKKTITFNDGITDEVYYFRLRMGQSNPNTSFYFGMDVTGDLVADLFIEANVKAQTNYVSFHKRDYSKNCLSPSQTSWLSGSQNQELVLNSRNAVISDYSAGTNIDGGNSGTDYWIEFAFTEEIIKSYVSNVFGTTINGDSEIAFYGFTSTSQTSNGDVLGVNDDISGVLDKTWEELGIIIRGTLNNISSGSIVTPEVDSLVTENTSPSITGSWGGAMLGDDSLSVVVDSVTYTEGNGLVIDGLNWSLNITDKELSYGSYEVSATTYKASSGSTATDSTSLELIIIPSDESSDTSVSSGNDGGLESNGDLANLIAQRNFNRTHNGNINNVKSLQEVYSKNELQHKRTKVKSLEDYLPTTGANNTEVAYVSSPEDLLQVTNAAKIFAVDYYEGNNRVAAALVTETNGKIYDHSKIICDRLNSSSLEDAWVFSIQGYQVISTKLKRNNGNTEYTLSFSVKLGENANELHSFWNIGEYPEGDYYNFQIWGSSFSQLFSICNYVLNELKADKALIGENLNNRIPSVFVSSGYYTNGELHLEIINKSSVKSVVFNGNYKQTEVSETYNMTQNISLSGALYEEVVVSTGPLFDVGFSITTPDSEQQDALYLADGPWGIDYIEGNAFIDFFGVANQSIKYSEKLYEVERQPSVSGMVKDNVNLFRHILPGDQSLDVTKFNCVEFSISNSQPIEIILIPEKLTDWNNRLRYTIPANSEETYYTISFDEFRDSKGVKGTLTDIKTIVFSVIGNYDNYVPFSIDLNGLAFGITQSTLGVNESLQETMKLLNYPNPFKYTTTIKLPSQISYIDIQVIDLQGRIVDSQHILPTNQQVIYNEPNLSKGLYKCILIDNNNARFVGTFLID